MKIQLACLLLMLLTATALLRDANVNHQYEKFIRQHIAEQMSAEMCDDMMQERNINENSESNCKRVNTFILSDIKTVTSVCRGKGEKYHKMTKSIQRFDIVVCKLINQRRKPCSYSGEKLNKKIIIKCVNRFPVHYDGDIGHCDN